MNAKRVCVVCGVDISKDGGRCTNSCCGACHAMFCTAGGVTSPGHGLNVTAARERYHARHAHDLDSNGRCRACGEYVR